MKLNITEPTLLLHEGICRQNISDMVAKASREGIRFRPHFKTHVAHGIGRWFKEEGVRHITVSSLRMAEYFAQDGWMDIAVAFPVNILEIDRINALAAKIKLIITAENEEALLFLKQQAKVPIHVNIKIDAGYGRTGIPHDDHARIDSLLRIIGLSTNLSFEGFLCHAGNSYDAKNKMEIQQVHDVYFPKMRSLKRKYQNQYPNVQLSVGDTPTCSQATGFQGADEVRPGNFVFYDLTQWQIGSNRIHQIAVAMACPIVAKHPARKEVIIHGGGVHFSKDKGTHPQHGTPYYGLVVELSNDGWILPPCGSYYSKMSQEHGTLQLSDTLFEKYGIGDIIGILPIHSCMTANLMREYYCLSGEVIKRM